MVDCLLQIKIVGIQSLLIFLLPVELLLGFHPTLHGCAAHLRVPNLLLGRRIEEVIICHLLLLWRLLISAQLIVVVVAWILIIRLLTHIYYSFYNYYIFDFASI